MDHVNSVLAHCLGVKAAYFGLISEKKVRKGRYFRVLMCTKRAEKCTPSTYSTAEGANDSKKKVPSF